MDQQNKNQAPADAALKTELVGNIPLHQAAAPKPVSEAENIDGIMKDVTQQLKQEAVKPAKHHWFGKKAKEPSFSAQPVQRENQPAPAPIPAAPPPTPAAPVPRQPAPMAAPAPAKPKSSVPVVAILFTLIITAFLVAAAVSAYKK